MYTILKKLPIFLYSIIAIVSSIILTHYLEIYLIRIQWINENEGDAKVAIYSSVLTLIGIFYGVLQLQSQRKDSLLANEYINQPDFIFNEFCSNNPLEKKGKPKVCCPPGTQCTNKCIDEHWFNLKQTGNLQAAELEICLFNSKDCNDVTNCNKLRSIDILYKDGTYQFKLPPFSFSDAFFNATENGIFYVLLSYKSLYSNLRYKRIYELEYSPITGGKVTNGLWIDAINFFSTNLIKSTDLNSISIKKLIIGKVVFYLFKLKLKNTYNKDNWIYKY